MKENYFTQNALAATLAISTSVVPQVEAAAYTINYVGPLIQEDSGQTELEISEKNLALFDKAKQIGLGQIDDEIEASDAYGFINALPLALENSTVRVIMRDYAIDDENLNFILHGFFVGYWGITDPELETKILEAAEKTVFTDDIKGLCGEKAGACSRDGISTLPETDINFRIRTTVHELVHSTIQRMVEYQTTEVVGSISDEIQYNYLTNYSTRSVVLVKGEEMDIVELQNFDEANAEFMNDTTLRGLGINIDYNWGYFSYFPEVIDLSGVIEGMHQNPGWREEYMDATLSDKMLDMADIIGESTNDYSSTNSNGIMQSIARPVLPEAWRGDEDPGMGLLVLEQLCESTTKVYAYNHNQGVKRVVIDPSVNESNINIRSIPRRLVATELAWFAEMYDDPKVLDYDFSDIVPEEFRQEVLTILETGNYDTLYDLGPNKVILSVILEVMGVNIITDNPDILYRLEVFDYASNTNTWVQDALTEALNETNSYKSNEELEVIFDHTVAGQESRTLLIAEGTGPNAVLTYMEISPRGGAGITTLYYNQANSALMHNIGKIIVNGITGENTANMSPSVYDDLLRIDFFDNFVRTSVSDQNIYTGLFYPYTQPGPFVEAVGFIGLGGEEFDHNQMYKRGLYILNTLLTGEPYFNSYLDSRILSGIDIHADTEELIDIIHAATTP